MKNLIITAAFLFISFAAFAQTTKKYSKTVDATQLQVNNLPSHVKIGACVKGSRAIIEYTVSANVSESVLDRLVSAGRYSIDTNTLTFPKMAKSVIVNGKDLEDQVTVTVYYPKK